MLPPATSSETNFANFLQVFETYLSQEKQKASLKRFHAFCPGYIVNNSDVEDVKGLWTMNFIKAVNQLKVANWEDDHPSWTLITQQIANQYRAQLKKDSPLSAPSPSPPSSSYSIAAGSPRNNSTNKASRGSSAGSSPKSSETAPLTPDEWALFQKKYDAMEQSRKWEIEKGVFVEDKMYDFAKSTKSHEHAAHSFILNLGDECWKEVFTESQLKVISEYRTTPLADPPSSLKSFLDTFKGVESLDGLWSIAEDARFHPVNEFDADWAKRSIIDILSAYRWGIISRIGRHGKERDLIMRVYRAIDLSFDNLGTDIQRSDQQSIASSARNNESRRAPDGSIQHKVLGAKPDMIIAKDMLEYGSAEHGYDDEAGVGAKELAEKFLKLPKTMKDMMLRLAFAVDHEEKRVRQLRVVGFSHTHMRTTAMVMDVPAVYVCRIMPLKERRIPLELTNFYKSYIPFLLQVYKIKQIVKASMDVVSGKPGTISDDDDDDDDDESEYDLMTTKTKSKLIIPSALSRIQSTPSSARKRKAGELEEGQSNA